MVKGIASAKDWIARFKADEPEKAADAEVILDYCQHVAGMLKQARESRGLNRDAIAAKLEVSPSRISQIESGSPRYTPNAKLIARWARACDTRFLLVPQPAGHFEPDALLDLMPGHREGNPSGKDVDATFHGTYVPGSGFTQVRVETSTIVIQEDMVSTDDVGQVVAAVATETLQRLQESSGQTPEPCVVSKHED